MFYVRNEGDIIRNWRLGFQRDNQRFMFHFRAGSRKLQFGFLRNPPTWRWRPFMWYSKATAATTA